MSALDRLVESGLQPYRAGTIVGACEVAGLVVLDPDDPEVIERAAKAISAGSITPTRLAPCSLR